MVVVTFQGRTVVIEDIESEENGVEDWDSNDDDIMRNLLKMIRRFLVVKMIWGIKSKKNVVPKLVKIGLAFYSYPSLAM